MRRSESKRPWRVLIIVENLPVPFDRRVWSEATTLIGAGYEVSVICPKGNGATASFEVIDGVHIFRHPLLMEGKGGLGYLVEYSSALFWQFLLSLKVLYRRGFDVIQACNPPDLLFIIGAFYKLLLGKRFVFDHHDIAPELYEAKFGKRGFLWRIMLLLERWTFAFADMSIATNESYRAIAIDRGKMPKDRVFVVRSGPNLARVQSVPADARWKKRRSFLVAYVGVIGKQEGLDLLLESIGHIRNVRGRNDVQYIIVGGGPELDSTKALATKMGLDDVVDFLGRVDDATLFSVLSTADVCVNPDRPNVMNDKSTMNKIMEYMALGKPIVQFDLTEGRFSAMDSSLYARNTDTADFGDKILTLLDDEPLRARMGAFGQKRVNDVLAWKYEAPKLIQAYDKLLGSIAPARLPERSYRNEGVS
jgi:glycosyltransferase involved in cell wall biosynthesis